MPRLSAQRDHDLRTPLAAVRLFVDHLRSGRPGPLNKQQADILSKVAKALGRLEALLA